MVRTYGGVEQISQCFPSATKFLSCQLTPHNPSQYKFYVDSNRSGYTAVHTYGGMEKILQCLQRQIMF